MRQVNIGFGFFLLSVILVIIYIVNVGNVTKLNRKFGLTRLTYRFKTEQLSTNTFLTSLNRKRKLDSRNRTYILAWTHPWDVPTEGFSEGEGNDQCVLTYDRSKLNEAIAVEFHYTSLNKEKMPWNHYRDMDQIFVLDLQEAPSVVSISHRGPNGMNKFDDFINWTMGYRTDNDVWRPYSRKNALKEHAFSTKEKIKEIMAKKKNMALWVVSNCDYVSGAKRRMLFVDELIKAGVKVDRFGKCFKNKEEFKNLPKEKLDSYKFYLAFENSYHCKDYITEKFWHNGLYSGRVPIVLGAKYEDMERIAPPGSFIHSEEFPSAETLAKHILYLDKNNTAYMEYFNWRIPPHNDKMKKLLKSLERVGLDLLCDKLMNNTVRKRITNMGEFYYNQDNKACFL